MIATFVSSKPDDIKAITPQVLNHRIIISPGSKIEGISTEEVITDILKQTALLLK